MPLERTRDGEKEAMAAISSRGLLARMRVAVRKIAEGSEEHRALTIALTPLLAASSLAYGALSGLRRALYRHGIWEQRRLPLPVISIGNLTWGGNGKTPMAEYLARRCVAMGVAPLLVTRQYGSGDELRLLRRRLACTGAHVIAAVDRESAVCKFLAEHRSAGCRGTRPISESLGPATSQSVHLSGRLSWAHFTKVAPPLDKGRNVSAPSATTSSLASTGVIIPASLNSRAGVKSHPGISGRQWEPSRLPRGWFGRVGGRPVGGEDARDPDVGVVILDDGMQHYSLHRDLEVVMLNAVGPWGNGRGVPWGPLREPLPSLRHADVVVLHHSNLVSAARRRDIWQRLRQHVDTARTRLLCSGLQLSLVTASTLLADGCADASVTARRLQLSSPEEEEHRTPPLVTPHAPTSPPPQHKQGGGTCWNTDVPRCALTGVHVLAVCGVGSPTSVHLVLEKLGAARVEMFDFGDHHDFTAEELGSVRERFWCLRTHPAPLPDGDLYNEAIEDCGRGESATGQTHREGGGESGEEEEVQARCPVAVVLTEKDFWRSPTIIVEALGETQPLVLCSQLELLPNEEEDSEEEGSVRRPQGASGEVSHLDAVLKGVLFGSR
eukprot:jgi/Mesvir1/5363/Mv15446-RA.1